MNQIIRQLAILGLSVFSVSIFASHASAQGFDVEGYLKKKDANNNGKIEPDEMSSNTRNWISKLGLDASKPVSISKIASRTRKSESAKAKAAKRASTPVKVPGFGVDSGEKSGVSSFSFNSSATKTSSTRNGASTRYSDSVTRQVDSTMEKYDRNRNGSLDKSEQGRARWGSPKPESSDLNKDGILSRDELAKRYQGREEYYKKTSTRSNSSRKAEEDRSRRDRDRRNSRSSRSTSSSRSSSSRSSSSRSTTSRSTTSSRTKSDPPKVDRAKYLKYAQSLVESYDKDEDGKLSKEEVKAMRRPPVGADTDKDGFISEDELVDSLSGANKSKASSTSAKSSSSSSSRSKYSRSRGGSSRSRRGSSSFSSLDADKDGQVKMHEYSKTWNDEIVAEFYEKDKNGDGIITSKEWSSK